VDVDSTSQFRRQLATIYYCVIITVNTNGHFGLYYYNAYKIKKNISGITVLSKYLNYSPSSDIAKPFDMQER
jgi:hypothetical protein